MSFMKQLLVLAAVVCCCAAARPCDVRGPTPVLVVDLPESLGNQTDQLTSPPELPLWGEVGEDMELSLSPAGGELFTLRGKRLALLAPIDRDGGGQAVVRFTVECRPLGEEGGRTVPVVVRVGDLNDNPPRFVGEPYEVTLPEDTPVGSTVFEGVLATDPDWGVNGDVRYTLTRADGVSEDPPLALASPHLPHLTLASPLDYETAEAFVLHMRATDGVHTATAPITLRVGDVDDQDPLFLPSPCHPPPPQGPPPTECPSPNYTATVGVGEPAGVVGVLPHRVRAVDLDTHEYPVRYAIVGGAPPSYRGYFSLHPRSGDLSLLTPLPRGVGGPFTLVVQAEEQSPRRGASTTPLRVTVIPADASAPQLTASAPRGEVRENAPPGTPVLDPTGVPLTLSVSDPDLLPGDDAPPYTFELTTGAFRVTPDGGLVVATPHLDRDPPNPATLSFQVVAREARGPTSGGRASPPLALTVAVGDENDNSPRFQTLPPVLVPAGGARPLLLATVTAEDPDVGDQETLEYRLVGVGGDDPPPFQLDPQTGGVTLLGSVRAGDSFFLEIEAVDRGGLRGVTTLEVRGTRGPNRGGPAFPRREYSVVIPEGAPPGGVVLTLTAMDPDGDTPRYSLHPARGSDPQPPFQVDPLTGGVFLTAPLDREARDSYDLIVTAEDQEGARGSAPLHVGVEDENDNPPTFVGTPYSFRGVEGARGVVLGSVKAEDPDEGEAGQVQYSVPPNSPVSIGRTNGSLVTNTALDYEAQQVHQVVVTAVDGGSPTRSASTLVTLIVEDVGDEPPFFPQAELRVAVTEDAPLGELIATVEAVDPDSSPNVTYVLRGVLPPLGTGQFAVGADTGRVTLGGRLDREAAPRHTLTLATAQNPAAGDGAVCTLVVEVGDVNDHTPTLSPLPPLLASPHTPVGGVLATATATDGDATAPLNLVSYSLEGDPVLQALVAVDPSSGVLTLTRPLTDLNATELRGEVVARDGGSPPRSSSTPLLLLVGREGAPAPPLAPPPPPAFAQSSLSVTVGEDARVGGILARVGVVNPPLLPQCGLLHPTPQFEARLTPAGDCALHLLAPLDAEGAREGNTVALALVLSGANVAPNATAQVHLTITDVNDNAPTFNVSAVGGPSSGGAVRVLSSSAVGVVISGEAPVGSTVVDVHATDPDRGGGETLHYSLLPGGNRGGYFTISPAGGRVSTARPLTPLPPSLNPFNLTVVASDRPPGGGGHQSTLTVLVGVIGPSHRVVVEVPVPAEVLDERRGSVREMLRARPDGGVVLERVGASQSPRAGGSTTGEVWLALLDPATGELLPTTHPRVNRVLSQPSDSPGSLRHALLQAVGEENLLPQTPPPPVGVIKTRAPPYAVFGGTSLSTGGLGDLPPPLQVGLVGLAVGVLLGGLVGVLVVCVQWARTTQKGGERPALPLRVPALPPLPPPSSLTDTLHKTYEVQVLHMSVPVGDDDSVEEAPPTPRLPGLPAASCYLDSVSYISRPHTQADDSDTELPPPDSPASHRRPPSPWGTCPSPPSHGFPPLPHDGDFFPQGESDSGHTPSAHNTNVVFGRRPRDSGEARTAFRADDGAHASTLL